MSDELDPALLAELAGIFREEASERLSALRAQLVQLSDPTLSDPAPLFISARREAHTLKGSAGTVGADEMRSIAMRLEKRLDLFARDARPLGEADLKVLNELCDRFAVSLAAF